MGACLDIAPAIRLNSKTSLAHLTERMAAVRFPQATIDEFPPVIDCAVTSIRLPQVTVDELPPWVDPTDTSVVGDTAQFPPVPSQVAVDELSPGIDPTDSSVVGDTAQLPSVPSQVTVDELHPVIDHTETSAVGDTAQLPLVPSQIGLDPSLPALSASTPAGPNNGQVGDPSPRFSAPGDLDFDVAADITETVYYGSNAPVARRENLPYSVATTLRNMEKNVLPRGFFHTRVRSRRSANGVYRFGNRNMSSDMPENRALKRGQWRNLTLTTTHTALSLPTVYRMPWVPLQGEIRAIDRITPAVKYGFSISWPAAP